VDQQRHLAVGLALLHGVDLLSVDVENWHGNCLVAARLLASARGRLASNEYFKMKPAAAKSSHRYETV
jgi:hypothetical protein